MSISNKVNESINDGKPREITLLLQIPKTIVIDKSTTMGDLKKISKQQFSNYADDFSLFIKDFDISTLENMNAIRTFDYYKSCTLTLYVKNQKKQLNESNFLQSRELNTDVETSQIIHESKEKNDIYKNMQNLQKRMEDIKKKGKDPLVVNQFGSPEEIINRSYAYIKNSQKEIEIPESQSLYNLDYQNFFDSNGLSKQKKNNLSFNNQEKMNTQRNTFSQTHQNFYNNKNEVTRDRNPVTMVPLSDRLKQFNQNISQLNSYNDSLLVDNMLSPKNNDQNIPREELENVYLTNKILNKSNMELKAKIKELENEVEAGKQLKIKLQEMQKMIENMNKNISNYEFKLKESSDLMENMQKHNNQLDSEIKRYKSELEGVNGNYEFMDKTNYELKLQIDNLEEINTKCDGEKILLNQHLNEKDKIIAELNEKIRCLNEVNSNTKKSCRDYEDMLNGMKKTIEIMKKSGDEYDSEMKRMKVQIVDLQSSYEKKDEEYINSEKFRMSLQNELELLKNEVVYISNERNNRDKIISDNNSSIRNLQSELDKNKLKIESLNKIVEEKDKTIDNMKNSVVTLNRNLEECRNEFDSLKRQLNEEMIEKSKLSRSKEQFDFTLSEYKKQIDELTKLKDNLYKQNFALEEDNSVFRGKFYSMRNENENLNMKINYLNEVITELNYEINGLHTKLNDSEQDKVNLNLNMNEIFNKISQFSSVELSLKNEIDNLNLRIENKEKIIEGLVKSKEEVNQEVFQAKEKMKSILNEKGKLLEEVDYKVNEIKYIESKSKRDNEKYANELKSKDNYIENLQKSLEDFKAKMNDLSAHKERDMFAHEKILEEVKRELEEYREKLKNSVIEKEELMNEIKYKNKVIQNLENNIVELNENIVGSKKNYEKLNNLYREHLEIIDELKTKNEELNKKSTNFSVNIDKVNEVTSDLRMKNHDLLNKNNLLQIENTNLKNSNEKLESEYKKIEAENKRLNQIENLKSIIVNNSSLLNINSNNNLQKSVRFENPLTESLQISRTRNNDNNFHDDKPSSERNEQQYISKEPLNENSSVKKEQINVSLEKTKNISSEINLKTSEVNSQLEKRRNQKVDILEGSKIIFSIFDNKRILRFDLENRVFKLIEFADFGNFENTFNPQGSIYLNILEGLVIVTGDNHDQFFHYSHTKHTMNKLTKLNNNHSYGSMIYYDEGNSVICLSGWHNKRVEKYVNDEIIFSFLKKPKNYLRKAEKQLKNTWSQLPELIVERSEASFAVFDKYIYGFFGFNCPQMKYLDTIERLNMENPLMWEMVEFKKDKNLISAFKKSHACIKMNDNEVLFIGGYDGLNDCPIENFSFFNIKKSEYYSNERKFPEISKNHIYNFQKNNSCVPYIDIYNRLHLVAVDEKDVVHVVDAKTLQYDLFVSFD